MSGSNILFFLFACAGHAQRVQRPYKEDASDNMEMDDLQQPRLNANENMQQKPVASNVLTRKDGPTPYFFFAPWPAMSSNQPFVNKNSAILPQVVPGDIRKKTRRAMISLLMRINPDMPGLPKRYKHKDVITETGKHWGCPMGAWNDNNEYDWWGDAKQKETHASYHRVTAAGLQAINIFHHEDLDEWMLVNLVANRANEVLMEINQYDHYLYCDRMCDELGLDLQKSSIYYNDLNCLWWYGLEEVIKEYTETGTLPKDTPFGYKEKQLKAIEALRENGKSWAETAKIYYQQEFDKQLALDEAEYQKQMDEFVTPKTRIDLGNDLNSQTTDVDVLTEDEAVDGYDSWTKERLKTELRSRGLKVSGSKDELIARLQRNEDTMEHIFTTE